MTVSHHRGWQAVRHSPAYEAAREAAPAVLTGLAVLVLVPRAATSVLVGVGLLAVLVAITLVAVVGFEGVAIGLLALGTALSPLDNLRPVAALAFASTSDLVLLLGVAFMIPVLLVRRLAVDVAFLGAGAGFVGVGLVSTLLATDPGSSLNSLLRLVVGALLLPIVYAAWRPGRGVVVLMAAAYLAGNVANIVAAYTVGDVGDGGRRIGYSTHPNVMGLCAMLGVALVPFLLEAVKPAWRWVVLLGGAVSVWGVWISGSRAALVAVIGVLALWVVVSRSVGVALALVGASIPPLWYIGSNINDLASSGNALGRLFGGGSSQASDAERELIARQAYETFLAHPVIGDGLSDVLEAHNIYLQVAAAVGAIGLVLFLVLLGSTALSALRLDGVGALLVLPVLGYAMIGFLTPILWDRYVWSVLALPFLAAASFAAVEPPGRHDPADPTVRTPTALEAP